MKSFRIFFFVFVFFAFLVYLEIGVEVTDYRITDDCVGYWDNDLNLYKEKVMPQNWMLEDLIKSLKYG